MKRVQPVYFPSAEMSIVNAARVSFDKQSSLQEDGTLNDKDKRLIKYLKDHNHFTPFCHWHYYYICEFSAQELAKLVNDKELMAGCNISPIEGPLPVGSVGYEYTNHDEEVTCLVSVSLYSNDPFKSIFNWNIISEVGDTVTVDFEELLDLLSENYLELSKHIYKTFRYEMPLFVRAQWFKSTVDFQRNEVSRRYVSSSPTFRTTDTWRHKPDGSIKQGSDESVLIHYTPKWHDEDYIEIAKGLYERMLGLGISPEEARSVLPQSYLTQFIETGNLWAYSRINKLRSAKDTQAITRDYAVDLDKLMTDQTVSGMCWKAAKEARL